MNTIENRRSPVYRQLEAYEETWKHDHREAMACRDGADAIAVGINIFRMLQEREDAWRDQVFRGTIAFTEEDNVDYRSRFEDWLGITRRILDDYLPKLEIRFGTVERASDLRKDAETAAKILREWQAPRLARAIGSREMTLTQESADALDRILSHAKSNPPSMPKAILGKT